MSQWWLPAATAIAAVALTYFFCLRPMRRGHCAGNQPAQSTQELDQALDQAHNELARLRESTHQDRHQDTPRRPAVSVTTQNHIRQEEHR